MLFDVPVQSGLFSENTKRGSVNRWRTGNKVRFHNGLPQKLGGWEAETSTALTGVARNVHDWVALDSTRWMAIGTEKKLYVFQAGTMYDITPLRRASTGTISPLNLPPLSNPFTTTSGLTTVVVTDAGYGALAGDRVIFSNATAVGGLTLNGEYVITPIDVNTYSITAGSAASSTATGGGSVNFAYEISVVSNGLGWGAMTWGHSTWGTPRTTGIPVQTRLWSLDNWGEDLIASPRNGSIYVWDRTTGPSVRAYVIPNAPTNNKRVLVSRQSRHLVAFGAGGEPLETRWSDAEDYNTWTPTATNSAGDFRIDSGSEIVGAQHTRDETLIFTDASVHAMRYDGAPFFFSFASLAENARIMGPNAADDVNGVVFFMGLGSFYVYDGRVQQLDSDVHSYVFGDINLNKRDLICCAIRAEFSEVWWSYPSEASSECDRYVAYNFLENHWTYGTLAMTAMHSESVYYNKPYAVHSDGLVYVHETGVDANTSAMTTSLESWQLEIPPGQVMTHMRMLIPDFETLTGTGTISLVSRAWPQQSAAEITEGPFNVTSTTSKVSVRSRNRQTGLKWEMTAIGTNYRMGTWRIEGYAHGRRM